MIKTIGEEEYVTVSDWWARSGFPVVPRFMLPSTGFISCVDGVDCFAGFLFLPVEGLAGWVEWIVSNPDANKEKKKVAFEELISVIGQRAKQHGCAMLFTSADRSKTNFINRLESVGFVDGHENVAQLIKAL